MKGQSHLYVINLERSRDRLDRISAELGSVGLTFRRIDAIDHSELDRELPHVAYDAAENRRRYLAPLSRNEIACFLSHRRAWETFLGDNAPAAIFLEDDAKPCFPRPDLHSIVQQLSSSERAELIKLYRPPVPRGLPQRTSSHPLVPPLGAVAYALNRAAARVLLEFTATFHEPVDVAMQRWWDHGVCVSVASPPLFSEAAGPSTIRHPNQKPIEGRLVRELRRPLFQLRRYLAAVSAQLGGPTAERPMRSTSPPKLEQGNARRAASTRAHLVSDRSLKGAFLKAFYRVVSTVVALPGLVAWIAYGRRQPAGERWGYYTPSVLQGLRNKARHRLWIHAVSVGEVNVALSLIPALLEVQPGLQFVLTMVTAEGRLLAERAQPRNTVISYAPLDFVGPVRRSFQAFEPDLLILVELEIWPNQLWRATELDVPVVLVNGRMPASDLRGYRRVRWFIQEIFGLLSLVCVQTDQDRDAFRAMGVPHERLHTLGNMKMDAALEPAGVSVESGESVKCRATLEERTVLIAASTHAGEEEVLLEIASRLRKEFPRLLLILAPRDISRASSIAGYARRNGHAACRWSNLASEHKLAESSVLIIDTIGDLQRLYCFAQVVFVGKSLCAKGGQNPMEPAAAECAIVFGPHMENFAAVVQRLLAANAAIQVADAGGLEIAITDLLRHPDKAETLGSAARAVVLAGSGVMRRTIELIQTLHPVQL